MKRLFSILMLVLLLALSGCAKATKDSYYDDDGSEPPTENPTSPDSSDDNPLNLTNQPALSNRKIIYTVDLGIVSTTPKETYNEIMQDLSTYDAYIESEEITSKIYKVTIRVKSDNLTSMIDTIQGSGQTVTYLKTSEDVTNSYSTLQARLEALQVQHARILDLMEMADNLDDILRLEETRIEIEAELNEIGLKLNNYDSLVEYSTIHLTISQVEDLNALLPKTETPSVYEEKTDTESFTISLNNPDDASVKMTVRVSLNGKEVKVLYKDVYQESQEMVTIKGLKPGQKYRVEVFAQADNHSQSQTKMIDIETDNTFFSNLSNVFMFSINALLKLVEFLILAVVAILPFAVVFTIVIGVPMRIYWVRKKKQSNKKPINQQTNTKI